MTVYSSVRPKPTFDMYALFALLFFGLAFSRFFVSGNANYGSFNVKDANLLIHFIELSMFSIIILWYMKIGFPLSRIAVAFIFFYLYAIIFSVGSQLYLLSAYVALIGILYALLGLIIGQMVKTRAHNAYWAFVFILQHIFWIAFIGSVIQSGRVGGWNNVIAYGAQGGSWALVGYVCIAAILLMPDKSLSHKCFKIIPIFAACLFLNSLSAFLAIVAGTFGILLLKRRFLTASVLVLITFIVGYSVLHLLFTGTIKIANKDYYGVTTGSGRFEVYSYVWSKIIAGDIAFLGYGFMAERLYLVNNPDLPWAATAHNSFLSLAMGIGYPGALIYVTMVFYLIIRALKYDSRTRFGCVCQWTILSLIAYGVTGPNFPGGGSFIVSLAVIIDYCAPLKSWKKKNFILLKSATSECTL